MAPYFGLRGKSLTITLSIVAATAFLLQGYDQAVMNGLLTLDTFTHRFPLMSKNPDIQGKPNHVAKSGPIQLGVARNIPALHRNVSLD